jgi:hypothetical protein
MCLRRRSEIGAANGEKLLKRPHDIALFEIERRKYEGERRRQMRNLPLLAFWTQVTGANIPRRGHRDGRPTTLASNRCPLQP